MKNYVKTRFLWNCKAIKKKDNISEFNQYMKPDKMPYIIYADIESLIEKKIDGCSNNSENSSTAKIGENILC